MSEDLKRNHHFVPQFWLRRFAGATGQLYSWDGARSKQVGSRSVMAQDWLYTVYDERWNASNDLENHLSVLENKASIAFNNIEQTGQITQSNADPLIDFIALQGCRHPDMLQRKLALQKEVGEILALSHDMTPSEFEASLDKYGIAAAEASNIYKTLKQHDSKSLINEFEILDGLGLQDSAIPLSDFLDAVTPIANALSHMNIRLLDAPANHFFILGDTPVPQNNAFQGFVVPLNKSLAVEFGAASNSPSIHPRLALSANDVKAINGTQWSMAKKIVVGPDPSAF
jgi:hypothetical protein